MSIFIRFAAKKAFLVFVPLGSSLGMYPIVSFFFRSFLFFFPHFFSVRAGSYYTGYCLLFVVLLVLPLVLLLLDLHAYKRCGAAAACCCFERALK